MAQSLRWVSQVASASQTNRFMLGRAVDEIVQVHALYSHTRMNDPAADINDLHVGLWIGEDDPPAGWGGPDQTRAHIIMYMPWFTTFRIGTLAAATPPEEHLYRDGTFTFPVPLEIIRPPAVAQDIVEGFADGVHTWMTLYYTTRKASDQELALLMVKYR